MQTLLRVIQWISAALEASRWQPPDESMFLDEQIQRGRYLVKSADGGDRRDSRKAIGQKDDGRGRHYGKEARCRRIVYTIRSGRNTACLASFVMSSRWED